VSEARVVWCLFSFSPSYVWFSFACFSCVCGLCLISCLLLLLLPLLPWCWSHPPTLFLLSGFGWSWWEWMRLCWFSICEVLEHTCWFLFISIHFFIFKVFCLVGLVFCRMMAMLDVGIHQSSGWEWFGCELMMERVLDGFDNLACLGSLFSFLSFSFGGLLFVVIWLVGWWWLVWLDVGKWPKTTNVFCFFLYLISVLLDLVEVCGWLIWVEVGWLVVSGYRLVGWLVFEWSVAWTWLDGGELSWIAIWWWWKCWWWLVLWLSRSCREWEVVLFLLFGVGFWLFGLWWVENKYLGSITTQVV